MPSLFSTDIIKLGDSCQTAKYTGIATREYVDRPATMHLPAESP